LQKHTKIRHTQTKYFSPSTYTIFQSEHDEKIRRYYSRRGEISRRDGHLFGTKIEELLTARLRKNLRFLERAKYIFSPLPREQQKQDNNQFRSVFNQNYTNHNNKNHRKCEKGRLYTQHTINN
jgi:hypothetical protein